MMWMTSFARVWMKPGGARGRRDFDQISLGTRSFTGAECWRVTFIASDTGEHMMIQNSIWLAPAVAVLAACQVQPAQELTGTVDTHEAMVRWVNPASLAIWDVTTGAMADTGGLDPTLMNAPAWAKLEAAARTLETHSQHMAQAHTLQVGAHNDNLEGFATRAEIQVMIDANPNGFRALSRQMAEHAGELVQAAIARDHRAAGALAESLSEQCSGCHTRYWEKPE